MSGGNANRAIRNKVVSIYNEFVSEIEPKDFVDFLIEEQVINVESKNKILRNKTKEDRCQALLHQLFTSSHDAPFVVLREAIEEKYPSIAECIEEVDSNYPNIADLQETRISHTYCNVDLYSEVSSSLTLPNYGRSFSEETLPQKNEPESAKMCSDCLNLEMTMKKQFEDIQKRLTSLENELKEIRKQKDEPLKKPPFLQNFKEQAADQKLDPKKKSVHCNESSTNQSSGNKIEKKEWHQVRQTQKDTSSHTNSNFPVSSDYASLRSSPLHHPSTELKAGAIHIRQLE